jgi:hypothetical protein
MLPVGLGVLADVVEGRARDDQRGPGLVDQDRVDLVDDRVVQRPLRLQLARRLHVVAEVVEAELVVGAVGDVAAVDVLSLAGIHVRLDGADGQAEAVVERAHPLGVAAGEVVVDGDDVDALAFERIQISGQGRDEGLPLAGDHLGDVAAVEDHPAHELDVVMPHLEEPPAPLAADGERFRQDVVEGLPLGQPPAELGGLAAQVFLGEGLHRRLQLVDPGDDRPHPPDLPLVGVAEKPDEAVGDPLGHRGDGVRRLIPNLAEQFHCRLRLAPLPGLGWL